MSEAEDAQSIVPLPCHCGASQTLATLQKIALAAQVGQRVHEQQCCCHSCCCNCSLLPAVDVRSAGCRPDDQVAEDRGVAGFFLIALLEYGGVDNLLSVFNQYLSL
jgi:hypothetical protein